MFRPTEHICVSPNKYGYHSIPLANAYLEKITLLSPNQDRPLDYCGSDEITLVAINPIRGQRNDQNATAYRNFLVELDYGPLEQQQAYVDRMKMPYSAAVFSGSKSLHFLISLDTDIPNEKIWRQYAEWTLKIMTMADQQTKNPSRSIRVPGALRKDSGKHQTMWSYRGPVSIKDFKAWLELHPDDKPKERTFDPVKKEFNKVASFDTLKLWVREALNRGITKNRNYTWFLIGCEFSRGGFSLDGTLQILDQFYREERDFKRKEWIGAVTSGYKHARKNSGT